MIQQVRQWPLCRAVACEQDGFLLSDLPDLRLLCRLIQVSLGVYRVFQTFFGPAEFPGYHQWQQESQ